MDLGEEATKMLCDELKRVSDRLGYFPYGVSVGNSDNTALSFGRLDQLTDHEGAELMARIPALLEADIEIRDTAESMISQATAA